MSEQSFEDWRGNPIREGYRVFYAVQLGSGTEIVEGVFRGLDARGRALVEVSRRSSGYQANGVTRVKPRNLTAWPL